jgi:hypothetical protein
MPWHTRRRNLVATVFLGIAWAGAVILGLRAMLNYASTPGDIGAVPSSWPSGSQIERSIDRPTLVMVAHPLCPCTRASVSELAQIMTSVQGKVDAYVLFFTPEDSGAEWRDTGIRRSAAAIPGVAVVSDVEGVEARRFGGETSGHTFLFDGGGHLLFSGGITQARGHSGENAGERAIISMLNKEPTAYTATLVFGCSLGLHSRVGDKARCLK